MSQGDAHSNLLYRALFQLLEEQRRTNDLLERLLDTIMFANPPSEQDENEEYVGARAISKALKVSESTFYSMLSEGLPAYRLPGDSRWRITRKALNEWRKRRARTNMSHRRKP